MSKQLHHRTGVIGIKQGMTQIFNESGEMVPVTLIKVESNVVIGLKDNKQGKSVVLSAVPAKKNIAKQQLGIFKKLGVEPMKVTREFRVHEHGALEPGSRVSVSHFVVGQSVDITGTTIGRGFTGVMKRHNFSGLEATHGVSISHRSHGSTGQCQDPGKVFKGKKMAGHYGAESITTQNLEVVDVNPELNLLAIKGSVPGHKNGIVIIRDAIKRALPADAPFPTFISKQEQEITASE